MESGVSNLGPPELNLGPTEDQVEHPQQLTGGADCTDRTDAGLGVSQPGRCGSTTGAQLSGQSYDRLPAILDDPDLRLVVERWPDLRRAMVRAILALVRSGD